MTKLIPAIQLKNDGSIYTGSYHYDIVENLIQLGLLHPIDFDGMFTEGFVIKSNGQFIDRKTVFNHIFNSIPCDFLD